MSIDQIIKKFTADEAEHSTMRPLLEAAITLDGRLSITAARESLTLAEEYLLDNVDCMLDERREKPANFSVSFRPHGRICFTPRSVYEENKNYLRLIAHINIAPLITQEFLAIDQRITESINEDFRYICQNYLPDEITEMCRELKAAIDHMAPLINYVGKRCFSNFYDVGKSGYPYETSIDQALQHVAQNGQRSEPDHLVAIYCLIMALRSGGYTRLEELNSTQLSIAGLNRFFENKYHLYCGATGTNRDSNFSAKPLAEKAAVLSDMRQSMAREFRFIRKISGANLSKREGFIKIAPFDASQRHDYFASQDEGKRSVLQRALPDGGCVEDLFDCEYFETLLERETLNSDRERRDQTRFEQMIDRVVKEAVEKTKSDFGMTRGARDFGRFIRAVAASEIELVSSWSQNEYFCHVVPCAAIKERLSRRNLLITLNSISGRMRYNTWHYAPSYFPIENIPIDRGWFMAPRMADVADHSDLHHTGHVHSVVKYSIRSPLPIRTTAGILQGFIDLRLMRQAGEPFDEYDLRTAIDYTECLQSLYQRLADHISETDCTFRFSFGDKKWFEAVYASDDQISPVLVTTGG